MPSEGSLPSMQPYPALLRKVTRRSHWDAALEQNAVTAAAEVFKEKDNQISVWFVRNDEDLRRVAVAMNEERDSLHEAVAFVAIQKQEFADAKIELQQTPGATSCKAAEQLHYDAVVDNKAAVFLCELLFKARRGITACTKGQMKQAVLAARKEGCFVVAESLAACQCGATRA